MAAIELYRTNIVPFALDSRLLAAVLASGAGFAVYAAAALLTRGVRISELRSAFSRG
jgi:cytidylate kinase